jgi:pimeloyl-ACP methyl ester carboxylesterase
MSSDAAGHVEDPCERVTKVVLLPGLDGTGLLFRPLVQACPPTMETLVVPLPNDAPLSYEELAQKIRPVLPVDSRYLLLGESFSGPLALSLASENPKGLCGIVLVASFIVPPAPRWFNHLPWNLLLKIAPPEPAVRYLLIGWSSPPELFELFKQARNLVSSDVMAARVRAVFNVSAHESAKRCKGPMLYLQGARDRLVHKVAFEKLQAARGAVEVRTVDAPHLLLQTSPEESWQHIEDFSQRIHVTS